VAKWLEVRRIFVPKRAKITTPVRRIRRSVVRWFLSLLLSPRKTLERERLRRKSVLDAAFARGRKVRRDRIRT